MATQIVWIKNTETRGKNPRLMSKKQNKTYPIQQQQEGVAFSYFFKVINNNKS